MRRLATLAFAVTSLAPVAAPRALAGACAEPPPTVSVLTPPDGIVAAAGGIVAEIETPGLPSWAFAGGKRPAATFTRIAPGLYVIPVAGASTLEDADHAALVRVTVADKDPPAVAAPQVRAVAHTQYTTRRGQITTVTARLKAVPPPDAIALVVFAANDGHPRTWARAAPDLELSVYAAGSCAVQRPGVEEPRGGDRVTLAWVDRAGRLSPRSAALTVATAAPP